MSGNINYGSSTAYFLTNSLPSGFIEATAQIVEERLTANGVDGARWRTVFSQFPEFQITTLQDYLSYDAAKNAKALVEGFKGGLVNLSLTLAGINYNFQDVHVTNVKGTPAAGKLVGSGVLSNGGGILETVWVLEITDFNT